MFFPEFYETFEHFAQKGQDPDQNPGIHTKVGPYINQENVPENCLRFAQVSRDFPEILRFF